MSRKYLASINSYFITLLASFLACTGLQGTDKNTSTHIDQKEKDKTKSQKVDLYDAINFYQMEKIKKALEEGKTLPEGQEEDILEIIMDPMNQQKYTKNEHITVLELLVKQYPSLLDEERDSLFTKCCQSNNYDFVKKFLELTDFPSNKSLENRAFACASEDYNESLRALFESDLLNFPLKNDNNQSILAVASRNSSINVVKFLFESKKEIEIDYQHEQPEGKAEIKSEKTTALIQACTEVDRKNDSNRLAIVRLLLQNNANPNLLDVKNQGAFSLAINDYPASGIPREILKNNKFKWKIKYSNNNTILHQVVQCLKESQEGKKNLCDYISKFGNTLNPGMRDDIYNSINDHKANIYELEKLLKLILEKNIIDPQAVNEEGKKAIDLIQDESIKKQLEKAAEKYKATVESSQNQNIINKTNQIIESTKPKTTSIKTEKNINKTNQIIESTKSKTTSIKTEKNIVTEESEEIDISDLVDKNDIDGIKNALTHNEEFSYYDLEHLLKYIADNTKGQKKDKSNEHTVILKILLEKHLETLKKHNDEVLLIILKSNNYHLMHTLLEHNKDYTKEQIEVNAFTCVTSPFHYNYTESLRAILQSSLVKFPLRNKNNRSILQEAAFLKNLNVVKTLIESKQPIEIDYQHQKPEGNTKIKENKATALMDACKHLGSDLEDTTLKIVQLLLQNNANPNLLDVDHDGAIIKAIMNSPRSGAARAILTHDKFDWKIKYHHNNTILHTLIQKLEISKKNQKLGTSNKPENQYYTESMPYINADIKELEELLKIILDKNIVDPQAVNKDGKKAIDLTQDENIKKQLKEAEEKYKKRDKYQFNIFHSKGAKIAGVVVLIIVSLGAMAGLGFFIMKKKSKNEELVGDE